MILVGNSRGNYKDAARHFLNREDNEQVIVHQLSGFVGDDLYSALQESYVISLGTKAKQHMYSLSLNPPKGADVSDAEFIATIDRAEKRLGLTGQPRAVVFHYKRGDDGELRKHAHSVWCKIDCTTMTAIDIKMDHIRLNTLSRELFLENGWTLPKGFVNKKTRDPLNFTHAEYQQGKRAGKAIRDIKQIFQAAWPRSDSKEAFAAALKEHGYILARGDRRAFVAVDSQGEIYAIARYAGIKTREVFERFGEPENLPFVGQAEEIAAKLNPKQQAGQAQNPDVERIKNDPVHLLDVITGRESTFTKHDIAKTLSAYISDPQDYQNAYQTILSSSALAELAPDNPETKTKARYSTREMIELERRLLNDTNTMAAGGSFAAPKQTLQQAVNDTSDRLQQDSGVDLSREQRAAIHHITGREQLSCVIGAAGAGKSTILSAARQAWETSGRRVFGAALAGKAAKGLEQSSGIQSRTLASFELSWQNGTNTLQKGDVLVIDEAGMIGSKQMSRFISEVKDKGAKIVLVGDAEQLQPIEAGAPFRAITEAVSPATLHEVHRQRENWQQQASKDFALGNTAKALGAYRDRDCIDVSKTADEAVENLVTDYMRDLRRSDARASQIALAHRKADVKSINRSIRGARKEAGELADAHTFKTAHGRREFAAGDRLLFTRNDRALGVKNGMLGTVTKTGENKLSIELDDKSETGKPNIRTISLEQYSDFDHGYATTIHKSQGATVDRAYVLASRTMDRHLTYVAMTRHRERVKLYTDREEFKTYSGMANSMSRARPKQMSTDFERRTDESVNAQKISNDGNRKTPFSRIWDRFTGERAETGTGTPAFDKNVIRLLQKERLERHMQRVKIEQQARPVQTSRERVKQSVAQKPLQETSRDHDHDDRRQSGRDHDNPSFEM